MDNSSRSERSRKAVIQAALTIIARDGPGQLTFDAIARESGISKGGVMHQFPSKGALVKGLLEHQIEYFADFARDNLAMIGANRPEPALAAQIAIMRTAMSNPHPVAFVILAALVEDPSILSIAREAGAKSLQGIKAEASDPELSMLRWAAARGLLLDALFGLTPFPEKERERLFERLLDDRYWCSSPNVKKQRPARPARKSVRGDQRR